MKIKQNLKKRILILLVCSSFAYLNPNVYAQQTPSYSGTGVFDKPVAVKFTGLGNTVSVGEEITPGVEVARNGAIINGYEWFLGNTSIGTGQTLSTPYQVLSTDHGKVLKVKISSSKGNVETEYQNITLGGTYDTGVNNSFPDGSPLDNSGTTYDPTGFPITVGQSFTDPIIDYTNSNANTYYYVVATQYDSTNSLLEDPYKNDVGSQKNIEISYLNNQTETAIYNCNVVDKLSDAIGENRTIFLGPGSHKYDVLGDASFDKNHLYVIGSDKDKESVIITTRDGAGNKYQIRIFTKILFENFTFDNEGKNVKEYYITFSGGSATDGTIFKKMKFRNIGAGTTVRGVFDFVDQSNRKVDLKRYFMDITFENSMKVSSSYSIININSTDGLYFRDIYIKGCASQNYPVSISNSMNYPKYSTSNTIDQKYGGSVYYNYGPQNIIFDGDLEIPDGKSIQILQFNSRGISLPETYRYFKVRYNWAGVKESNLSPTPTAGSSNYAFLVQPNSKFTPDLTSNYIYLDAKDGKYIVAGSDAAKKNQQLNNIQTFLTNQAKNYAKLPTDIKIISNGTSISSLSIPSFGGQIVNIAVFNDLNELWSQTTKEDMVKFGGTILLTSGHNVKLHNIDFTGESLSTIYHATGIDYISGTEESTIFTDNSTNSTFFNCLFKNFATEPVAINGDAVVILGNTTICDDDPAAALPVDITGIDNDKTWDITFQTKGDAGTSDTQSITGPAGSLTLGTPPATTTTYELTAAVGPGNKQAFITGTGIATVGSTPTIDPITGASSLQIGSTATLSSATSGGSWSSLNTGVATVDAISGVVSGVANGNAVIVYSVTENGCTSTVQHNLTVEGSTTPPPIPKPDPEDPNAPDPNPDGPGLSLQEIAPFCFEDREFRIPYE